MYLLIPLILINGMAHNRDFVNTYRITIAGMPVNIFDILIPLGLVLGFAQRSRGYPTDKVHPMFFRTLVVLILGCASGCLASAIYQDFETRYFIATLRNYMMLPLATMVGYLLLRYPSGGKRITFWAVIAGMGASLLTMIFFKERGELSMTKQFDVNFLRTVEYGVGVGGIAGAFLIFTILSGVKQFPRVLAIPLAGLCILGQCATLSRSDWVATLMCVASVYFLLSKDSGRLFKYIKAALLVPLLVGFALVGLYLGGQATGRDFQRTMQQRLESLLPFSDRTTKTVKAWDSRLPGAKRELELWAKSPLIGCGFGHYMLLSENGMSTPGYGHNTWTFTLFQTGPLGFIGCAMVVGGCWVVGRRIVLEGVDRNFVLLGALGAITGVWFIFHGLTTASFNGPRQAMLMGLTFGMTMRARAMQLSMKKQIEQQQQAEYEWGEADYVQYEPVEHENLPAVHEPIFGNWYQPN